MLNALQWFVDLGATVVLPILIFAFGLILGAKPGKAFISGLKVGIGFVGLNLVIGLLGNSLGPAAQTMVERFGLSLTTIDVGWPAAAAISYGTILGSLSIPIGIVINILLLVFGLTKTLNVDIWNFWHAAFAASLVYVVSGNFALGLFATAVYFAMIILLGDMIGPIINKFYGFPNITFPHGTSAPGFIFAVPMNWLFDRIPGFRNLEADPETIQKKFGIFGDTTVMGLMIGLVIGVLAGYDVGGIGELGVSTAAVMILMPRMVSLLMEGLTPISESATEFVRKRFPGRELYIGMDSALSVGHPAVLSSSLLLVPITIALAIILPGNTTLPFGDLATIPFVVALMAAVFGGNIIRTVVGGTVYMASILYITSWVAPLVTEAAIASNFDMAGNTSITAMAEGGLWTTLMYVAASEHLGWIGIGAIGIVTIMGLYYVNKLKPRRSMAEGEK
ncbi:PTS galactitol transporter subunit IIC [Halolactibacillus alkaliphilus]|uniref:PTS galactitol transporter subunit IIC n=1 Tax=Halolactibacillus alkaliphilus TaxID=442899 RepID=A0A511WZK8_9BACI|nr:PTS transporter subunit IIC [Halolactibacillus alkaliphilus]GEN56124.1 PTS galactitol transporter subunit IIC [Halolactibacillus alkaliphilus]GGN67056.1 PTS galactitol transporter subunit IIC [Halolactibacillus alkaliphilus]SFO71672.1 PTS system IIC component, Gat family (TC 4.A.5) [Halolactibacillus alkaliphilus]